MKKKHPEQQNNEIYLGQYGEGAVFGWRTVRLGTLDLISETRPGFVERNEVKDRILQRGIETPILNELLKEE